MAGWRISGTCCGWGERGWSQVLCCPLWSVEGGSVLPTWVAPLGYRPFLESFCAAATLVNSLWLVALGSCFALLSREEGLLRAPLSAWDGAPGWLSNQGCCWEQKGLTGWQPPTGKEFSCRNVATGSFRRDRWLPAEFERKAWKYSSRIW